MIPPTIKDLIRKIKRKLKLFRHWVYRTSFLCFFRWMELETIYSFYMLKTIWTCLKNNDMNIFLALPSIREEVFNCRIVVYIIRYISEHFYYKKIYKDFLKQGKILPIINDRILGYYFFYKPISKQTNDGGNT